jgi:hypothetical protein
MSFGSISYYDLIYKSLKNNITAGTLPPPRTAKTITVGGNTKISTVQSKFGGSSALFDGSGDFLTVTTSPDLGTLNDFTIEFWIYRNNTNEMIPVDTRNSTNTTKMVTAVNTSSLFRYINGGAERIISNSTVPANQWVHLAIARSSNLTKMFVNGTEQTGTYTDSTPYTLLSTFRIGANFVGNFSINGYLDEIRVSKIARYTSNFTPSTTAFTNDENTLLLIHADGTNNSTTFTDDNS